MGGKGYHMGRLMGWTVWRNDGAIHVMPEGENHIFGLDCWCDPDWDDWVWIHHSRDGREANEVALCHL